MTGAIHRKRLPFRLYGFAILSSVMSLALSIVLRGGRHEDLRRLLLEEELGLVIDRALLQAPPGSGDERLSLNVSCQIQA